MDSRVSIPTISSKNSRDMSQMFYGLFIQFRVTRRALPFLVFTFLEVNIIGVKACRTVLPETQSLYDFHSENCGDTVP